MFETQLIKEVVKGNHEAFKKLYKKHCTMVYRTALGLVHQNDIAEDIVQEVFIDVFNTIKDFKGKSKFSTWLYRIAVNKSLNYLRSNRKVLKADEMDFRDYCNPDKDPQSIMESNENSLALHQAIDSLPENQRVAFVLCKFNDLSYSEIAETMELSLSSVESLIFRARKGLQSKLLDYYKKNIK